ncbi:hypothetical protein E3N88_29845 [Mikania micrantha]|uniref:Uncharacterized protein n=1 Tax=Mikania micrantha TaxID=192012 RepID=A0A5N6MKQ0_9ASTR|nr:hypothetical protein E3N88_29845 [Mikania micrantha]
MSEGNSKGKGVFGIFEHKKTSSKYRSKSRGKEERPSKPRLSQEPDASGYCMAIPSGSRHTRSHTPMKESTHMTEEYEQDSPDEWVPMEFLMNNIPRRTRNPEPSSRRTLRRHEEHGMADSHIRSGESFGQRHDALAQQEALW